MSFFRRGKRPDPPPRPEEAALAHAVFCDRLPSLRAQADRYGWRRELEAEIAAVKDGRPAAEAMHNLMLDNPTERGADASGLRELWEAAPIGQRFTCPRFICPERGRGKDASEPWCNLDDQPMTPATRRLGP